MSGCKCGGGWDYPCECAQCEECGALACDGGCRVVHEPEYTQDQADDDTADAWERRRGIDD
jgi:hypothetical protein